GRWRGIIRFFAGGAFARGGGCYAGAIWAKYNIGVISMLFEQEHLLSLTAIVSGILVLILASRKRRPS
ncbi:MAG: hypothetical protein MPK62_10075, partial [Alphaproteobacteria bacterium]|nr:hypothetical protein [Alphaproteobacteria bacterium]MDA8031448.1 hypothetical protein [Alphaproteobacteria bacterium]